MPEIAFYIQTYRIDETLLLHVFQCFYQEAIIFPSKTHVKFRFTKFEFNCEDFLSF